MEMHPFFLNGQIYIFQIGDFSMFMLLSGGAYFEILYPKEPSRKNRPVNIVNSASDPKLQYVNFEDLNYECPKKLPRSWLCYFCGNLGNNKKIYTVIE